MSDYRYIVESYFFGVCSKLGDRLNIDSGTIRLYFVYTSFLTFGSPIIIYLILAFWLNIRKYRFNKNRSVWDL
jgi:phage shock protein PspC (stress-responsive transcriptional regulator)